MKMTLRDHLPFSLLLLYVATSGFYSFAFAQYTRPFASIQDAITASTGTHVVWVKRGGQCSGHTLMGYYDASKNALFVCQGNHEGDYEEILGTLKHEGWHAVQQKCNSGKAALSDDELRNRLRQRDKNDLRAYPEAQQRMEAEARVMELLPTSEWISQILRYCISGRSTLPYIPGQPKSPSW